MARAPGAAGLRATTAGMQAILDEISGHQQVFNLADDGLGADLAHVAAEAILDRMGEEKDPDGADWDELSAAYARWKRRQVGGEPISVLYHRMRTIDQLTGELSISDALVEQVYGTDEEAKQEAAWFSEGRGNQQPRPFYALGDLALARLDEFLDEHFARAVDG